MNTRHARLLFGHSALFTTALALAAAALWESRASGQAFTFTPAALSYTEPFDSMGAAGTTFVPGWTSTDTIMLVTNGSGNTGSIYNVGATGDGERAFGSLGATVVPIFGASFFNDTGANVSSLLFAGVMEQWRSGSSSAVNEVLPFEFSFDAASLTTGTWSALGSFNLVEKLIGTTVAGAVDGNAAANKTAITGSALVSWAVGTTMWIRWSDTNDGGSDGLYAIDDFKLTVATAAPALYWDLSGSSAGVGGAFGTWNLTEPNWTADPTGASPTGPFTPENEAIFAGGSGDVNIAPGGVAANGGLRFESPGYIVGGGPLTLGGPATIQTIATAVITARIAGESGLVKAGGETLFLTGLNTFTGSVSITGGVLSIAAETALGAATNDLVLANGAFNPTATMDLAASRDVTGGGAVHLLDGNTLTTNGVVNLASLALSNNTIGDLAGGLLVLNGPSNTIGNLTFTDPVAVQAPNGLALGGNITVPLLAATASLQGAIAASNGAHTFEVADGPAAIDLLLAGDLSSAGFSARLTKSGAGALRLTGSNAALLGGWRLGSAGLTVTPGGRLLVGEKNALGAGAGLQVFFNEGLIEAEAPLVGPNALTVGLSLGAGQETASGSGVFTANTFAGSPMEFTGIVQIFKPGGVTAYQHRIVVNTDVTFAGGFNSSTGTTSTGITLTGAGRLVLSAAANTVAEGIIVEGPEFVVAGSLSADSVFVKSGGFQGSGAVGELFIGDGLGSDSRITIGDGVGSLMAAAVTLDADAIVVFQIDSGVAGGIADQLRVAGDTTLGDGVAVLSISDLSGVILPGGTSFTLIDSQGAASVLSGFFAGKANGDRLVIGANEYEIAYGAGPELNDVTLTVIPEPASALLLACGGMLLAARRRSARR